MGKLYSHSLLTVWLLAIVLVLQSCTEQSVQLEKQKVQFTLTPASAADGMVNHIDLPENAVARISLTNSNGASIFTDHEITVSKTDEGYVTDRMELTPGGYVITDFLIVKDSVELYVTPKQDAELSGSLTDALPYNFSITENNDATVSMLVMDVRSDDLERFGYTSAKVKDNTLSLAVYTSNRSLTSATAELRQNNKLLNTFSLAAAVNTISLGGNTKKPYSLTVYTANSATTQVIDLKKLKDGTSKKKPLALVLEPALVLAIESYVDEANEYEEYFEFRMEGTGSVNINWGDGQQTATTLPLEASHEYFTGNYRAIITGSLNKVTDFSGFSYSSIITAITGLTNLTSLKVYDPSWGAVPIKVDLSNCKKLERINVAKYGAPYEPADLRTDFKLPRQHRINTFIFDAPSFDSNREYISAEELEVMVDNIYNNTITRKIYNGKFFVNPVVTPSPAAQQKIDVLKNQYNWAVGFNDEIYNAYDFTAGRMKTASDSKTRRDEWLRERFPNSEKIIQRAHGSVSELISLN